MSTLAAVDAALARVCDPCSVAAGSPLSLPDMGLVRRREVAADGSVRVVLGVTGPGCTFVGTLVTAAEREVRAAVGDSVPVRIDIDPAFLWTEADLADGPRTALAARRREAERDLRPRAWETAPEGAP